jgi:uncharacterized membrane protein YphA (DoxX/SURF4 family)
MPDRVDRLHAGMLRQRPLVVLAAVTRVLLALAFLPSGLVKLMGQRFTTLPATTPVGHFFDGFFAAPEFYRFVGAAQLTAAVLLLFPQTAALGAALYLPIVLNIFVITVAVEFRGTQAVTGLMLLANLLLLAWDYDRWKSLLPRDPGPRHLGAATTLGLLFAAGAGFLGVTRLHLARLRHAPLTPWALVVSAAAALALLIVWRSLRRPPAEP